MSTSTLTSIVGALLILTGLFVPSSTLIAFLRATPIDLMEQLLLGATLFKAGLVTLGLLVVVLGRMPIWQSEIRREASLSEPRQKFVLVTLAAILLTASALRLYGLNSGLWYDEILTYVNYVKMPFGEILTTYDSQNQHPLYTLLAHASFLIFGEGAWSLRLPAVLFGVGSLWALYLFGRQVGSVREALLSVALLAFSYHHVWFSQNARGYTGLLFWTVLASWLFLRGLGEARPQLWLLYAAAAALGVYTHMTMLFVIAGHFIVYLIILLARRHEMWPHRGAGCFLGFGLAGLLIFQLHALVLPQIFGDALREVSTVPTWSNPLWTLLEFAEAMEISFRGTIVAVAALLVFGAGLFSFARTNPVVIQLLVIPALICAVIVIGMGHHLWPRFFFFTAGFGMLVIVRGTMLAGDVTARVLSLAPWKSGFIGTALCIGLLFVSALSLPFAYAPKQDYLGALNFVEVGEEPGDAVVTVGLTSFPYKDFYHKMNWEAVESLEALNTVRSRANHTWLLYTFPVHVQSVYPEIMTSVQRDFEVVKQFYGTVGGGTIFVCRSNKPFRNVKSQ